jgi:putative ABC transport system permease protein
MKFLPLIVANLFRKKLRTTLTIGSFFIALFLFGLLAIVRLAFVGGTEIAGADRLVVVNKVSIIQPIPLAYRDQILRIPGVKNVTHDNWFGGVYQDPKNFFAQFAIDSDNQRQVYPEMLVSEDQWQAFLKDREGAIVGETTAKRFGWKIGDRIPLKVPLLQGANCEFNIVGIYHAKQAADLTQFWLHYEYLDERRQFTKGLIGWYVIKLDNPDSAVRVAKAVDGMFANSPYETKTETERAFAAYFAKQLGSIEFLILAIGSVVFFTLLLVTGNTMAIAVRERTSELAVLKAIGFTDRFVVLLVLGESLLISLIGGLLGLGFAKLITLGGNPLAGVLAVFILPNYALVLGVLVTILVGILAGIVPAINAMRLRLVVALRRV